MKQRKLFSRIISLALAVCMLVAVAPTMPTAQAEGDEIVINFSKTTGGEGAFGQATLANDGYELDFANTSASLWHVRNSGGWFLWREGGFYTYHGRDIYTQKLAIKVNVPTSGYYTLKPYMRNEAAIDYKLELIVNGKSAGVKTWATGETAAPTYDTPVYFRAGTNVVVYKSVGNFTNNCVRDWYNLTLIPATVEREALNFSFVPSAFPQYYSDLDVTVDGLRASGEGSGYGAGYDKVDSITGLGGKQLDFDPNAWSTFIGGKAHPGASRNNETNESYRYQSIMYVNKPMAFQFNVDEAGQYDLICGVQGNHQHFPGVDIKVTQGDSLGDFELLGKVDGAINFTAIDGKTITNANMGAAMQDFVGTKNWAAGPVSMTIQQNSWGSGVGPTTGIWRMRDAFRLVETEAAATIDAANFGDEGYVDLAEGATHTVNMTVDEPGSYMIYVKALPGEGAFAGSIMGGVGNAQGSIVYMNETLDSNVEAMNNGDYVTYVAGPVVIGSGKSTAVNFKQLNGEGYLDVAEVSLHKVAQQMWMISPATKTGLMFGSLENGYGWKFRPELSGDYGMDFEFGNCAIPEGGAKNFDYYDPRVRYYFDSGVDANGIRVNRQKGYGHLTFDVEIPAAGLYDVAAVVQHAPANNGNCGVYFQFTKGEESFYTKHASALADEVAFKEASMGTIALEEGIYQVSIYGATQDDEGNDVNPGDRKYINLKSFSLTPKAAEFASLSASIDNAKLMVGGEAQVTVSGKMSDGAAADVSGVAYSVEGDAVEVDANGVVSAVKAGTATITASATVGAITKTASVTVKVMDNVLGATYAYVREDKSDEAVSYKLALFGGVNDNENIAEVGFEVVVNGNAAASGSSNVYTKIALTYKNGTAELLPAQLGASYIFFDEQNYDASFADAEVSFRAYVIDGAGETYYGEYASISSIAAN